MNITPERLTLNVVKLSTLTAYLVARGMSDDDAGLFLIDVLDSEYTWGTCAHSLVDLRSLLPDGGAAVPTKDDDGDVIVEAHSLVGALVELCASTDEPIFLDLEN